MNSQDFAQYEPVPFLLEKAEKTEIPLIYLNKKPEINPDLPIVFILIGPSGSGKDTISDSLYSEGVVVRATTATGRPRREEEGEPEERHIWMRTKREDETVEAYDANLIKEYNLIEYDRHFGNLYGLPLASLEKAMQNGTPLIRTEPRGAKTICTFLEGKANCIVVFIVPESFKQVWARALNRVNFEERKEKAVHEVKEAPEISNFYLFNPEVFNGSAGLPQAQQALIQLIRSYAH